MHLKTLAPIHAACWKVQLALPQHRLAGWPAFHLHCISLPHSPCSAGHIVSALHLAATSSPAFKLCNTSTSTSSVSDCTVPTQALAPRADAHTVLAHSSCDKSIEGFPLPTTQPAICSAITDGVHATAPVPSRHCPRSLVCSRHLHKVSFHKVSQALPYHQL
jgi:hypothetical protein